MKRFHIRIADNETGEVWYEGDGNAIIGAVNEGEHVAVLGRTECSLEDIAKTINGAQVAVKVMCERNPTAKKLLRIVKKNTRTTEDK